MAKPAERAEGEEALGDPEAVRQPAPADELSEDQLEAVSGGYRDIAVTWAWKEQQRPAYQPPPAPDRVDIYED